MNFEANCIVNVDFIEHIEKKKGVEFIKNCKIYLENQINEKNKMLIIGTPSFYSRRYRAKHNILFSLEWEFQCKYRIRNRHA